MNESKSMSTLIYLRECLNNARKLRNIAVETSNQLKTVQSAFALEEKSREILKIKEQAQKKITETVTSDEFKSGEDSEVADYTIKYNEMLYNIQAEAVELIQMANDETGINIDGTQTSQEVVELE